MELLGGTRRIPDLLQTRPAARRRVISDRRRLELLAAVSRTHSSDGLRLRGMNAGTAIAIALAIVSTTLANIAYLREHDAAASLPCLSMRRPLHSAQLLLTNRSWLFGFAMETGGFLFYAAALALASLALVQSIAAGGIGVLAYVSSRVTGRPLGSRQRGGVIL